MSDEKSRAEYRLHQAYLLGRFAGPIMQPEIQAELRGIQAYQEGMNYNANPYDDSRLRLHWVEGYATRSNMRYPTYKGASARIPRPPRGHIV